MTNNLINIILATCLLFSSLNLAAEQISPSNSKAEVQFLAGETCLKQANIACAMAALAKIPSSSPYAKLLQGEIAYTNQALDQALQLLLPLQAETQFSTAAKISLHQYLAKAFAKLQDAEQALVHLLQVDLALSNTAGNNQKDAISANQAQIWDLLSKLDQNELLAMRGNNTDDNLQGWVDLALAAKNQDLSSSLKSWQINYPDHSATALASSLQRPSSNQNAPQLLKLASGDAITISYLPTSDANNARVDAFKAGLIAALAVHGLNNAIQIYTPDNQDNDSQGTDNHSADNQEPSLPDGNTTPPQPNTAYAIHLDFANDTANAATPQKSNHQTLTLGLHLNEEAQQIVKFAVKNAINHVAIITNESFASAEMLKCFSTAWQQAFNLNAEHNSFNIITLPQNISANDLGLLDIQTKINAKAHDMVILALPTTDARIIKPYLSVGTPTLAFSNIHETTPDPALSNVRFVEIPFLLPASTQFSAYQSAAATLSSNDLLRWYALGVDALPILVATQQTSEKEVLLNGLSGKFSIKHGSITRQPSMARFSYEGISQEQ
ncbi:penicillin-binding protein activator [Methylotenera sp.]|uniref:penicillin-binding protein activator n=1 Tax=Methylotenera sp. TaxID=2051956 RepID=UPI002ED8BE0A